MKSACEGLWTLLSGHLFVVFLMLSATSRAAGQPVGTFTSVGNMTTPRIYYTATLLRDGRVLIAGGSTFGNLYGNPLARCANASAQKGGYDISSKYGFVFVVVGVTVCAHQIETDHAGSFFPVSATIAVSP